MEIPNGIYDIRILITSQRSYGTCMASSDSDVLASGLSQSTANHGAGRNGRGKTTFLNLLLGKYEYRGSISTSVAFSYFPYYVMEQSILAKDAPLEVFDDRLWLAALDCVVAHSDGRLVFKFYGDIEVEG